MTVTVSLQTPSPDRTAYCVTRTKYLRTSKRRLKTHQTIQSTLPRPHESTNEAHIRGQARQVKYRKNTKSSSGPSLQTLTNNVSYLFARATKAVSLVSPAYYADLACERGRCYLHSLLQGVTDIKQDSRGDINENEVWNEASTMWRNGSGIGENIRKTMFYI